MVCPLNLTEMEAIYQHEQVSCVTLSYLSGLNGSSSIIPVLILCSRIHHLPPMWTTGVYS